MECRYKHMFISGIKYHETVGMLFLRIWNQISTCKCISFYVLRLLSLSSCICQERKFFKHVLTLFTILIFHNQFCFAVFYYSFNIISFSKALTSTIPLFVGKKTSVPGPVLKKCWLALTQPRIIPVSKQVDNFFMSQN